MARLTLAAGALLAGHVMAQAPWSGNMHPTINFPAG